MKDKKYVVKEFIEQGIATKTNYTNKKTGYNKHILSRLMGEAIHKRIQIFNKATQLNIYSPSNLG